MVYTVGDEPEAFYVVALGEVQRDYEDGSDPIPLRTGTYFGEVGMLLPETKCFATIKAGAAGATLLTICKADFSTVCNPDLALKKGSSLHRQQSALTSRSPVSPSGPSGAKANKAPGDARSLHHALLVELLIKLRRSEVRMHVLLQHPRAHRDFLGFALAEMRGALRIEVYNHASTMLQRVRAAIAAAAHVSSDTQMHMKKFLDEQAKVLPLAKRAARPAVALARPRSAASAAWTLAVASGARLGPHQG